MRTVLSVIAAYAAWSVLWVGLNAILRAAMPASFNEDGTTASAGLLVGVVAMSGLISVSSGWLAAKVAPKGRAALWTAILLLATGIPIEIGSWSLLPVWYHLSFLALLVPATILGGSLGAGNRTPATA